MVSVREDVVMVDVILLNHVTPVQGIADYVLVVVMVNVKDGRIVIIVLRIVAVVYVVMVFVIILKAV